MDTARVWRAESLGRHRIQTLPDYIIDINYIDINIIIEAGTQQVKGFAQRAKDEDMTTISVIVGSTRKSRFAEKPALWILQHLRKREGIDTQLLDLRDFSDARSSDEGVPPAMPGRAPYPTRWLNAGRPESPRRMALCS